jgi:hypothetical protein
MEASQNQKKIAFEYFKNHTVSVKAVGAFLKKNSL